FNDAEYLAVLQRKDGAPQQFRAFQVPVGNQVFWNVNEVEDSFPPKSYAFTRVSITSAGELSLQFVADKGVPKALESDAPRLVAYLASHSSDPSLDDKDRGLYLWRRPKEGEVERGVLRRASPTK